RVRTATQPHCLRSTCAPSLTLEPEPRAAASTETGGPEVLGHVQRCPPGGSKSPRWRPASCQATRAAPSFQQLIRRTGRRCPVPRGQRYNVGVLGGLITASLTSRTEGDHE